MNERDRLKRLSERAMEASFSIRAWLHLAIDCDTDMPVDALMSVASQLDEAVRKYHPPK